MSKPLHQYIVKIDKGYYSEDLAWQECTREQATRLSSKAARKIRDRFRSHAFNYPRADFEEVHDGQEAPGEDTRHEPTCTSDK